MKQTIFKNIRLIAFALVLAIGASYASATVGTGSMPGSFSPSNNTDLPINVGFVAQNKGTGDLGGLSVNNLLALQTSLLQKETYFQGAIHGNQPGSAASTVFFGSDSPSTMYTTDITTTGGLATTKDNKYLRSDRLANTTTKRVCATSAGVLTLTCPPATPTCQPGYVLVNGSCQPIPCVANVTFSGDYRWGKVAFSSTTGNNSHAALTVTVKLVGSVVPPEPFGGERYTVFTMPANSTNLSFDSSGSNCNVGNSLGCEIEGTGGFDHGFTTSVSPSMVSGGRICVQGQ